MNFWQAQIDAKIRSQRLLICYVITVLFCIFVPYLIIHSIIAYIKLLIGTPEGFPGIVPIIKVIMEGFLVWRFGYFFIVAPIILFPILLGTFRHYQRLREGGSAVAYMLGGSRVRVGTIDFYEKRLLNIVEEMSLASGVPMPKVYILHREPGINALMAGFKGNDAVICVTRGATELLQREELQGVIAHEFSHLLNGDMAFHTFMLILMHGFFISSNLSKTLDLANCEFTGYIFGDFILHIVQITSVILLLPLWLWLYSLIFGNIGRMVKGAFSRQREYLADAAAAQFTRYPKGLADTMKKIAGLPFSQRIRTYEGSEMNHLFFTETDSYPFSFLVAAHPPIKKRIKQLLPEFDGKISELNREFVRRETARLREDIRQEAYSKYEKRNLPALHPGCRIPRNQRSTRFTPKIEIDFDDLLMAAVCLDKIPNDFQRMIKEPAGAMAVVYALILSDQSEEALKIQLNHLKERYDKTVNENISKAMKNLKGTEFFHMPLVELAVCSLEGLSKIEYDRFLTTCYDLILLDNKMSLYEYSLISLIKKRLDRHFGFGKLSIIRQTFLRQYSDACALILSVMGWAGAKDRKDAEKAFEIGTEEINKVINKTLVLQDLEPLNPDKLNDAVANLNYLPPKEKELLFNGCLAAVGSENEIKAKEWDILQSFARMLDCPIPLLPEKATDGR